MMFVAGIYDTEHTHTHKHTRTQVHKVGNVLLNVNVLEKPKPSPTVVHKHIITSTHRGVYNVYYVGNTSRKHSCIVLFSSLIHEIHDILRDETRSGALNVK